MGTTKYLLLSLIFYSSVFYYSVKGFLPHSGEKIVGGGNITIQQAPYQLSLRHNTTHICGASIIKRQWALTAAHCFDGYGNDGLFDLLSGTDQLNQGGRTHPVTKLYIHPNVSAYFDFNVALIYTYEPFEFSEVRQPIPIATSRPQVGDVLFASGWGATDAQSMELSNQLQGVSIGFIAQRVCESIFGDFITDRLFCAGENGKGPCTYDFGGPLVFNNTLVGVFSVGACGGGIGQAIFSDVAHPDIQQWIKDLTEL